MNELLITYYFNELDKFQTSIWMVLHSKKWICPAKFSQRYTRHPKSPTAPSRSRCRESPHRRLAASGKRASPNTGPRQTHLAQARIPAGFEEHGGSDGAALNGNVVGQWGGSSEGNPSILKPPPLIGGTLDPRTNHEPLADCELF